MSLAIIKDNIKSVKHDAKECSSNRNLDWITGRKEMQEPDCTVKSAIRFF